MTTTKAKTSAPKTSELVTADNAAITVQATELAPITVDASAKWESFTSRPGILETGIALKATAKGFKAAWENEKQSEYGKAFVIWSFANLRLIAMPILSLLWLGLNHLYQVARKPETKASIAVKWQSLKAWAAPKFDYERDSETDEAAIDLN